MIRGRFLLIFALDKLNVRHISTSGLVDQATDRESVSRDAHLAVTVSTKFEVDMTIRCHSYSVIAAERLVAL